MIVFDNVSKVYPTLHGPRTVLESVNLHVEKGEKIAIIGGNGSGKSTLIRVMSGAEPPTSGRIYRGMNLSWPLNLGGGFQGNITAIDNLRFLCRIYGVDFDSVVPFVADFSELGPSLNEPVDTYSSGMKAKLAFALSFAIEFDCYLIDEVFAVGDAHFQRKCQHELFEKRHDRAIILVSHSTGNIKKYCERAYVLHQGLAHGFPDTGSALEYYGTI